MQKDDRTAFVGIDVTHLGIEHWDTAPRVGINRAYRFSHVQRPSTAATAT
jgi:hypothetical protein